MDLLARTGLLGDKLHSTPLDPSIKLYKDPTATLSDVTSYRRMVGRLLYLTHTRADLTYAINHLGQFLDCPAEQHYQAALNVLKFIEGSPVIGTNLLSPLKDLVIQIRMQHPKIYFRLLFLQ